MVAVRTPYFGHCKSHCKRLQSHRRSTCAVIKYIQLYRYLYTDTAKIIPENVMDVLYIAKKYCVDMLAKMCSEFLQDKISHENVCQILEAAHKLSDTDIF